MNEKIVKKEKISDFLAALKKDFTVFVPIAENGPFRFEELDSSARVDLDYRNTERSPKGLFFPQSEPLYAFHDEETTQESLNVERRLVFGMRPCDAKALHLLDKVFGGPDFQDPYYQQRREQTTVISLACTRPQITCFCTSLGGDPGGEEGSDILFFDLEDDIFVVKTLTEKGERVLQSTEGYFADAKTEHLQKRDNVVGEVRRRVMSNVTVEGMKEKLHAAFEAEFWEELHQKCLGCGICTYLCPTCHCFDVTDEVVGNRGRRMRCWDSCMYPLFALHASGHNPRPTQKERMRQRIMHKFNYCPENLDHTFCVGCGRCVRHCPVNLDIREVIQTINT